MPRLLYRYMLGELLRVMLLSSCVLVTVIAFGATIKPLAQGLLAPADIAKYVALAIVPMLQFALPFSAGFASTLVMHRMVNDNEITAMAAAGLSHRRILAPLAAMGAALTLVLLILVHLVVPQFWVLMQKTVERDIVRLFETAVENREAFKFAQDSQVYAEEMVLQFPARDAPAASDDDDILPPDKRLWLGRVAVIELDKEGRITRDVTGQYAVVDFYERDDRTYLVMTMHRGYAFEAGSSDPKLMRFDRFRVTDPIPIPDTFSDKPKFMSLPRILWIRDHPDSYAPVIEEKQDLAGAIRLHEAWREIDTAVAERGRVEFQQAGGDERYVVHAGRYRARVLTRAGVEPVTVDVYRGETLDRRIECRSVELSRENLETYSAEFTLTLADCRVYDAGGEFLYPQTTMLLLDARPLAAAISEIAGLAATDLLQRAKTISGERSVTAEAGQLAEELYDLHCETAARLAHRTALSMTGFLLLVLGALLAMRLRETLPLVIYLLAFLPSILDILLISGGEQMMRDHQLVAGFIVMWSGNIALLLAAAATYLRIVRN